MDDFETLVREIDVRALVLQYHPENICTSAETSISRTSDSKWPATA
jgi:anthranilate/para-aminobenzoate synthase component II